MVSTGNRIRSLQFAYDARGNVKHSFDDAPVFFDRCVGAVSLTGDRLTGSALFAPNSLTTEYDGAGNLTNLSLTNGPTYTYTWDEMGHLASATRADPSGATLQDQYAYDAQGRRVRITGRSSVTGDTLHTVQVFDSLVLKNAVFPDQVGDYEHDDTTEHLYLSAAGLTLGHAFIPEASIPSTSSSKVHVFMPVPDPLGSTSFVIDHDSGELVEAATYLPYGGVESDYRPARWDSFREDIRYTSHWDDAEVGLVYMNARYYSPQLHRFISPDPQTIHRVAGDLNPYAYAFGSPLRYIDPLGLDNSTPGCNDISSCTSSASSLASTPPPRAPIIDNTDPDDLPTIGVQNNFDPLTNTHSPTVDERPSADRFVAAVGVASIVLDPGLGLEESAAADGVGAAGKAIGDLSAADIEGAQSATEGSTTLATADPNIGVHAAKRMAQRGITEDMINAALDNGTPFVDPKNGTVNYVLQGGMASGQDLLVGTNPFTGKITTAITGTDLVVPRFLSIETPAGPPILLGPGGP